MSFMSLPVAGLLDNDGVGVKGSKRTVRVKVLGQELSVPKSFPARCYSLSKCAPVPCVCGDCFERLSWPP